MRLGDQAKFFAILFGIFILLITADHGLLTELGMGGSAVAAVVISVICAGLLSTQGWLFVALAFVLLVTGQSSSAAAHILGLQQVHLLALFIGVVLAPYVLEKME